MRVYRIISAREITNIYKGTNERSAVVQGENTYKYEPGISYIHFFRYYESAKYLFERYRPTMNSLDRYIAYMTANIPNEILRKRIGYGFYNLDGDYFSNYYVPIPEYAIKEEEMSPEYIVEINNLVSSKYLSDSGEYKKYLELLKKMAKKYKNDFSKVANYLENCNLEELLDVKDDDRTESEIFGCYMKKLSKIFPLYD